MELQLIPKLPDSAYVGNMLWLPKALVYAGPIKGALEFDFVSRSKATPSQRIRMWGETTNHIVCPREFIPPERYTEYDFPFVDIRPTFETAYFEDLVTPRDEDQRRAWTAFSNSTNGVLNLACGHGKTKLALKKIAQVGTKTLVVVPDGGILDQWKRSIDGEVRNGERIPPGLRHEGAIGVIQGDELDWEHDIVIALVTTLWKRIERGALPLELRRTFGLVVFDEVHQMAAPKFNLAAPYWYGDRLGLTATVSRDDGLDPVYLYHIGRPFYSDLSMDLIPDVEFARTPVVLNTSEAEVDGVVHISRLRSLLGVDLEGNTYRYWRIREALERGRKILCLSHSKAQLKLLHACFPGSGLIIGDTPRETRLDVLRESRLCFAIARLGAMGVDDDRLDRGFWLTPFSGRNTAQQSLGRFQRRLAGKPHPVFTVFEDFRVKSFIGMCSKLKTIFRSWEMPFTVCPTEQPRRLPSDVQESYDNVRRELTDEDLREDPGVDG